MSTSTEHDQLPSPAPSSDPLSQLQRLVIVSNRLPVTCVKQKDGGWTYNKSSGGLVTALSGIKNTSRFVWIGWPGVHVDDEAERREMERKLFEEYSCIPVWMDFELMEDFYNGFSNGVLWPLFHYIDTIKFNAGLYEAYVKANELFAQAVTSIWQEGDMIWIHDYHLMLMPLAIRQQIPTANMGFFLHIPFPSSEVYKILPCRAQLLEGVLSCDLVGFHTWDYSEHFLKTCTRILGAETQFQAVIYKDRRVPVRVFPVGIDVAEFERTLITTPVKERLGELYQRFKGKKVILGVDRLDYIKGLPHKLEGYELFLSKYPEWRQKVVLIQVAVPSREDVPEYQKLKKVVDQTVGRINMEYGSLEHQPIHYLYHSVNFTELCALYTLADAVLITSLRDGMNLVAEEYIVCQKERKGALIISEFAGAAQSLSGSILINPWNPRDVATGINKALSLAYADRAERHNTLYRFVSKHTSAFWGTSFIESLVSETMSVQMLLEKSVPIYQILKRYTQNKKRLLVFQSDGVLSLQAESKPSAGVLGLLKKLSDNPNNIVVIISGNTRDTMEEHFDGLDVALLAEHGFYYRPLQRVLDSISEEQEESKQLGLLRRTPSLSSLPMDRNGWRTQYLGDSSWMDAVRPIFDFFSERTRGSKLECHGTYFTWNYRNADPFYGESQARALRLHMDNNFGKWPIEVTSDNKTILVRNHDVNPSSVLNRVLRDVAAEGALVDYALYVGTTAVDHDAIAGQNPEVDLFSCLVGKKFGSASFLLQDPLAFGQFLDRLSHL